LDFILEWHFLLKRVVRAVVARISQNLPGSARNLAALVSTRAGSILAVTIGKRTGGNVKTYLIDKAVPRRRLRRQERRIDVSRTARSQHRTGRAERPSPNVDQVLDESFPASDPPSWTGAISRIGRIADRHQGNE
jgi:hypothetical protein